MSLRKILSRKLSVAFALACLFSIANQASVAASVAPRVVDHVDESRLTTLRGNVPLLAQARFDRGAAPSSTQFTHVHLVLARSAEQQVELNKYLSELQDKSSANYHKWLTPEQFGKQYGPADSDVAAIVAWIESHGLKLEQVSVGRTNIAISGTASQLEEAFHTKIHSFDADGQQFFSNVTDPSVPAALAPVVSGVAQLNTIRPRAHHVGGQMGTFDSDSHRLMPIAGASSLRPRPDLTTGTTPSTYGLYLTPGDAATIYDTPNTTFNLNYTSGTTYDGAGVTIGVGGRSGIKASTVAAYRSRFLGNSTAPTITNPEGVTANGDTDEAYIDTELAGAMAPGATIHYYISSDLISGINQALDENTVDIFSLSFGACESNLGTSNNALLNGMWEQAEGQGIAVTVSTGDNGSAACDNPSDTNGNNVPDAIQGLQVSGFASTPHNVAVGGTDFSGLLGNFPTYAPAGGTSSIYRSAKSYIPESTWNDSTQADGSISANTPYTGTDANIVGGSGGASSCSTKTAGGVCSAGYAKPTWQRGHGTQTDSVRDIPDISLMAGNGADAAAWLICTDDTNQAGTLTANCTIQTDSQFYFEAFGGTSTSAPAFAGILALVQQKTGSRLGQAAQELYNLYNGTHKAAIFHDITVGNNAVACNVNTPNCVKNTAGFYFESGYDTTTGYDLATGLGSVDAKQLITYWGSAVGSASAAVGVTPSASTVTTAQAFTVATAVTGASGTPTGTVTLTSGSYTSGAKTLTGGAYTFSVAAGALAAGAHTLTVSYSGDATYASTTGSATITVEAPPAPSISLSPTSLVFAATVEGQTAAQTVTVTNTGSAPLVITGVSITGASQPNVFSETSPSCTTIAINGTCTISVTFTPHTFGSFTASVSITDNASNSPQTVSLTGTGTEIGSFSLTTSTPPPATVPGSTATATITATPADSYTGTITLTCSVASITNGKDIPTCSAPAPITIAAGAVTGTVTLGTTAPHTLARRGSGSSAQLNTTGWLGAGGAALACVLFFGVPARKRAWRSLLTVLIFIGVLGALSGCGGGGGGGTVTQQDPGTTPGAYTVTVTGTDAASVVQTTTFTFTVN